MFKIKNNLWWITVAVIIGVFYFPGPGRCASARLKFILSLDKTEYTSNDPINASFILKNVGSEPVMVNQRFYVSSESAPPKQKDVYFELISPSGQKLICQHFYPTGYPKTDAFKLLAPNEEAKSEYPRNLRGFFEIKQPGTYTLKAVYKNMFGQEIGLEVFQEELVSDPVKFTVVHQK